MSSRDAWSQLRGSHRSRDLSRGLRAAMADPHWMLARQRQFGAFQGEDAASPVKARLRYASLPIEQFYSYRPDGRVRSPKALDRHALLESIAERESITTGPAAIRISGEAGIQFLRRLPDAQRSPVRIQLRKKYPLPKPRNSMSADETIIQILRAGSFDARRFIKAGESVQQEIAKAAGVEVARLKAAHASWKTYYAARFVEPTPADFNWRRDRLEYRFSIAAKKSTTLRVALTANEYTGGRLDWCDFDLDRVKSRGLDKKITQTGELWLIPTPVRYAGMPADRFWNFEDHQVFFGGISAGAADLAQVILTEFATVYSNDWYVLPLPVQTGTLTRVNSVEIMDSFGRRHVIKPAAVNDGEKRVWRFFEFKDDPSTKNGFSPWLFVPRTVLGGQEGQPVEKTVFSRDEMANLAWGVEEIIEGASGQRILRRQEYHRMLTPDARAATDASPADESATDAWQYRLISSVPPNWVPFVPEIRDDQATNRLLRARMEEWEMLGTLKPLLVGARGRIMDPNRPLAIQEEEIPRGGIVVTRSYQAARSGDGSLVIWLGRRKRLAGQTRSSGRQTDQIEIPRD